MELDLRGSVAIVTGGGRGIGREIVDGLAREGAKVVAVDVNDEDLEALREAYKADGREGLCLHCDVRDSAQVREVVATAVDTFGRVDILVNNAGVAGGGPVEDLDEERWRALLDVNLTGPFLTCKAVIPHMKRQRYGRIINASSYAAITPGYGGAGYAASKAGVIYLTRVLAGELGPWNITANSYAPGMIPTQMNHFADLPADTQDTLLDMLALRRWGAPEDIVNLIVFLASEQAGYITGTLIDASGGKLAVQRPQQAYEHAGTTSPGR
jgi:3-oxoacyl-[acyl-carrier protein] reductase